MKHIVAAAFLLLSLAAAAQPRFTWSQLPAGTAAGQIARTGVSPYNGSWVNGQAWVDSILYARGAVYGTGSAGYLAEWLNDSTLQADATGAYLTSVGTTAQRPTGAVGLFRYNTTEGELEFYGPNTSWWGVVRSSDYDLTAGSVLFTGANGGVAEDNTGLNWNNTSKLFSIARTGGGASMLVRRTDGKSGIIQSGALGYLVNYDDSGIFVIGPQTSANIIAGTTTVSGSAMYISSGNMGIWNTSPGAKVDIGSDVRVSGGTLQVRRTGAGAAAIVNRTDGKSALLQAGTAAGVFGYDNTGYFAISPESSANILSGVTLVASPAISASSSSQVGIRTVSPAYDLDINSTGGMRIPSGTTAQRPTGAAAVMRFNSDTTYFEGYDGSSWLTFASRSWVRASYSDGSGTADYLARWGDSNTLTTGATRDDGTNVSIGIAPSSTHKFYSYRAGTETSGYTTAGIFINSPNPSGASTATPVGVAGYAFPTTANTQTKNIYTGGYFEGSNDSNSTIDSLIGADVVSYSGAGTITNLYGLRVGAYFDAGAVTNRAILLVDNYGSNTPSGENYAIKVESTADNLFTGNVRIKGTTAPAYALDMGSATGGARLPNGTTAQRPTNAAGVLRWNTTDGQLEIGDGSTWTGLTGTWLKPELEAGNDFSVTPISNDQIFEIGQSDASGIGLYAFQGSYNSTISWPYDAQELTGIFFYSKKWALRAGYASASGEWDDASIGAGSVAMGENNTASGDYSAAAGIYNVASGEGSTAFGDSNTSSGTSSFSIGNGNVSSAASSAAIGYFLYNDYNYATVVGALNDTTGLSTPFFIVGNGTDLMNRSNAFIVQQNGDIYAPSYDDTKRDSAAHLVGIQEATGKLVPIAQVNAKYMEDTDLTLTAAEIYKFQEVRVWMSTTAGASSQTELTIPDAAAVYLNTKIVVVSKDASGTYNNLINTPGSTMYDNGSDASSYVVAAGATVVLWCVQTGASTYRWAIQQ